MANYEKSDKPRQNRHRVIRWIVLGLILGGVTTAGYMHQHPLFGLSPVGVDALCPFGGLESAWKLITSGDMLTKIAASSFILLAASILVTVLFRRAFCGQLCPLGTLQGLMAGLGRKIFKRKFKLPKVLDKAGRFLKYFILAGLLIWTWVAGSLVVRPYDPWVAFMHLSSSELVTGFLVGLIFLALGLVGSLFYDRFFCKYFCPMGAAYGLVSKVGLYKIKRNETTCIDCKACDKVCPVDLPISTVKEVTSAECITCSLCVNTCPVKDTLGYEGPKKTRLSPLFITSGTVIIFAAVLVFTSIPGWFAWTPKSLAEENHKQNSSMVETAKKALDPDTIKGRNTFTEVAEQAGISKHAFIEKFSLKEEDLDKMIKDVAAKSGGRFGTDDVRNFVAEKLGIQGYHSEE